MVRGRVRTRTADGSRRGRAVDPQRTVGDGRPEDHFLRGEHPHAASAQERGADEALFANTSGNLCEATGSNVFVVVDGVAITPPASAGCLLGVTSAGSCSSWPPAAVSKRARPISR